MKELQALLDELASRGRNGDTMLAHINPQEAELLKAFGGSGTTNPETGLPEFWGGFGGFVRGITGGAADIVGGAVDTVGNIGQGAIDTAKDIGAGLDRTVRSTLPGGWTTAALLAAGYYYSPEINAYLSADGTTMAAASDVAAADAAATAAAEQAAAQAAAEQLAAQQAAAHVTSSVSAEALAAANATADPLGALIAEQGWSVVDPAYLEAIGVTYGMAPAVAAGVSKGLTFSQAADLAKAGLLVNAITGDPLGLGGGQPEKAAPTRFEIVPVPTEWKSPTYATSAAPIDLESIFSNQNMLGGTQWQDLPSQRNMSFNDIFAAGQQQTPMGTPVDINQIVGSILGQTATR